MNTYPDKYQFKKEFLEKVLPKGETFSFDCSHCKDRYINYLEGRVHADMYLREREFRTHHFFKCLKKVLKFSK